MPTTRLQRLPLRSDVIAELESRCQQSPLWQARSGLTLHYFQHQHSQSHTLGPHIDIQLALHQHQLHAMDVHQQQLDALRQLTADIEWLGKLELCFISDSHSR